MARQKRQSVNDWEERNKRSTEGFTHETTESTRIANRRGYDRYLKWKEEKERKEREDIISRVNDFASRSNQFASEARRRSGTDRYRTDSQDWLASSQERRDSMRQEAKEIGAMLFQNQHIFDREAFEEISAMIRGSQKSNSQVVKAAENEVKYFSQWDSEEAYNKYQQERKDYEAKRTFDVKAGEAEVEELRAVMEEANLIHSRLQAFKNTGRAQSIPGSADVMERRLKEIEEQYGSVESINEQYSQKNQYLTQAKHIQEGERLSGVGQKGSEFYDPEFMINSNARDDIEDVQYRYINDEEYRRQYQKLLGDGYDNFAEAGLDILTDDERRTYNYYYAKGGKDAAQEYLTSIQETLNYRKASGIYEDLEDNTLLELAFGVEAGIDQWQSGMSSLINNRDGAYIAPSAQQMVSGMVREDLGQKGKIAQGAYDLITTTANMAPSILSSTVANILLPGSGTYVGSAMMGASATGNAYQEILNAGYSKDQARAYGTMVGASEAILGNLLGGISSLGGKVSGKVIGNLMSKVDNVIARTAIKIGGNMLSEGFEEGLQEVLTPWFKSILTHEEYAAAPEEVLYAGLLGALSAGLLEGPTTIAGEYGTYRQGLDLKAAEIAPQRLAEIGQKFSADTVAYQLAGRVNENTGAYTIGRLFNEIGAELTDQNKADITENLVNKGMTEDHAKLHAEVMAYIVEGGTLSDVQMRMIESNDVLAKTMQEVIIDPNSTVNQRIKGFNEVHAALSRGSSKVDTPATAQSAQTGSVTASENTDFTSTEVPAESHYEASADGKTILKSTGETVEIKDVAGVKNGQMTFNLQDGRTVSADEVSFGSEGDAMVYGAIAELNVHPRVANVLVENYRLENSIDAEVYARGIQEAYRFGENNYPMSMAAKGPFTSMLTPRQRKFAYEMGQAFGTEKTKQRQAAIQAASVKNTGPGKVHFDGDRVALSKRQQDSLTALDRVASTLGVQFYIFDSKSGKSGETANKNGWFDPSDNSIHIDLHAGEQGKDTILFTASHELTHFLKEWDAEKYKALSDFLMEEYGKLDVNVDELVQKQVQLAKDDRRELTQEQAFEEVIANSMETMLADGNVVEKLEKLKAKDRTLWEKIRDYIKNLVVKIRKAYEGLNPDSEEGKYVAEMKDAVEQLQNRFAEGLSGAGENYRAAMERGGEVQKNTADEGGVKYSLRQFEDGTRFVDVQTEQDRFEGLTVAETNKLAKTILQERFVGRVIGVDNRAFVNGDSANEYIHPSKNITPDIREAKMRASSELDNLLDAGTNFRNAPDGADGHVHPNVTGGFDYFDTIFKVGDQYYSGVINIMNIKRGKLLKDITKIKNITKDIVSSYGINPKSNFLRDASMVSIRGTDRNVNQKLSERSGETASTRVQLADAFEGLAQTELERKKVQEYREKAAQYDQQEQKLRELRGQIRELSFAKGPRDKQKLRELRDEATRTANRINIYDKQLLRLEASAPLKAVLEREKARAARKLKTQHDKAMADYRAEALRKQEQIAKRYQESRKQGVENRNRTAARHKVQRIVNELNQYLLKGTKERHVPESLQKAVAEALNVVNMDTVGAEERIAKLKSELMNAKTPEQIQEISRKIDHVQAMGDRMKERLQALKDAYAEFINAEDSGIQNSYDDVIISKMETVLETVGDTPLRDMSLTQLDDVYDMYKAVLTVIRNANKAFKAGKSQNISELSGKVMDEVRDKGKNRKLSTSFVEGVKKFGWDNLKPVYAFEHIGSKTLAELFSNVRSGEDAWAKDVSEAREFYRNTARKHHAESWDRKKRHEFESTSGMKFSLDLEQIMSLYAYSKREQAADHLRRGGIVFDETTEVTVKTKMGVPVKFNPTEATAYNISNVTLGEIVGVLTKEQKQFVDEMQEYLSNTMGDKGNEVSMEMYGIRLFKEKNYFPLKSAQQFMAKAKEKQKGEVKIKNSGFSKATVKHASNPVVLTPFMNVWADHVNEMSMYHAFVLPMEDFYRVYNFKTATSEIAATESVEMLIQNAFGKGATKYIDQLLKDLNGGARTDPTVGVINKSIAAFKKGAVFASASVVIQQPSAVARALAMVDAKYFIGRLDKQKHGQLWGEVKKYAPVAIIKEMGYFDTNMGRSTEEFILGKEYGNIAEKAKALVTDGNYRDEILSRLPALADEMSWCTIWQAVKRETIDKYPGMMTRNREEFMKIVGKRFTEVIVKTQVYDSVLSRSALMRSKDTGMKMATSFMAEPTTSMNMIADALTKAKHGNARTARKAIGAVIASQILNAMLVSIVYAARDDDEEKNLTEKYISSLVGKVADSMNPLTYIPFLKDIISIVQGYDVERSDMSVISDLWNAWNKLDNENLSAWQKVEGFAGSVAQIFGLPLKNIMRDVRAIWQVYNSIANGEKTTAAGIRYAIQGALAGKDVSNQKQLYEAEISGDENHAQRVRGRYKDESKATSAMRSEIRDRYQSGELDRQTAMDQLVRLGGMNEDDAYWRIEEWDYALNPDNTEDYSKYSKFYNAVRSGENLKKTVQEYIDNGVSQKTLINQITEYFREEYVGKNKKDRIAMKGYLVNGYVYCGMSREDALEKIAGWDFQAEHGFDYEDRRAAYRDGTVSADKLKKILMDVGGLTEDEARMQVTVYDWQNDGIEISSDQIGIIEDYENFCEPAKISRDVYYKAYLFYKDAGEEGVAYSKTKECMPYIDSLPLTAEQKTALALCWWAESTVKKYKTW